MSEISKKTIELFADFDTALWSPGHISINPNNCDSREAMAMPKGASLVYRSGDMQCGTVPLKPMAAAS
jgi:hypothetical protein